MVKKNKKGWIRIMEAFVSILLIVGVLLVAVNQSSAASGDMAEKIYRDELTIIKAIEYNSSLRASILSINEASLPIDSTNSGFPANVNNTINANTPSYLSCSAKICALDDECLPSISASSNIYALKRGIFASLDKYSPRKIALFCSD